MVIVPDEGLFTLWNLAERWFERAAKLVVLHKVKIQGGRASFHRPKNVQPWHLGSLRHVGSRKRTVKFRRRRWVRGRGVSGLGEGGGGGARRSGPGAGLRGGGCGGSVGGGAADADAGGSHSSCMAAPVPGAFAGDARLAAAMPPINRSATRVMSWLHVYGFAECSQQQPLPDPTLTSSSSSSFVGTAVRFSRMDAGEGHGE